MAVKLTDGLPAEADFVHIGSRNFREVEAGLNGGLRKACVVRHARNRLFSNREQQFAVAHDACGGIVHLRIVDSEGGHEPACAVFLPKHQASGVSVPVNPDGTPPAARTISSTCEEESAAPRQVFPSISGSIRASSAQPFARRFRPIETSPSRTVEMVRPFQFMVGLFEPLNWKRKTPPGRRIRSISRMEAVMSSTVG